MNADRLGTRRRVSGCRVIVRCALLIAALFAPVMAPVAAVTAAEPGPKAPELISVRRIWNAGPHNAFTDLVRHGDAWFCVFREGQGHVSPDGAVQVLTSKDGETWTSAARLTSPRGDLRDPKIVRAPGRRLMIVAAIALPAGAPAKHQSLVWFSDDGRKWDSPTDVGDPDVWLWRVAWRDEDMALGIGYDTQAEKFTRLYRTADGKRFETVLSRLFDQGYPNETGIAYLPDQTAVCLLRRDGTPGSGLVGVARPPYEKWDWKDLGVRIGGPQLLRLPDGRLIGAVRLYDGGARTALVWVDADKGRIAECLKLPSGGDTSYPGMVWHDGQLGVSYYSSHEGQTSIYFARVRIP